ncbi:Uncharacterised protein [Salmonella enterica subsp. enterica]|nr:Uncharacterised protein [Salmonella enterica subsp. enterica] [Salmonella enterica subsp. enterica serovar Virchow]
MNSNILLLPIFDSLLYLNHFRKKIYLVSQ